MVAECKYCSFQSSSRYHISRHLRLCRAAPQNKKWWKLCPVCSKKFWAKNKSKPKTTCSHACSNVYFRKGIVRKNQSFHYARICWRYHKKQCIICKEVRIVAAHHYDKNKKNNKPWNFVPLCPTHHAYCHSRFYDLIVYKVHDYVRRSKLRILKLLT
jgi:hypothetical protein